MRLVACFISTMIFSLLFSTTAFAQAKSLRVMSYNVNGLPWPLEKNKRPLFMEIARIIKEKREKGIAPHVLVIQEGFRPETKEMVAAMGYPYVFKGPNDSEMNPLDKKCPPGPKQPPCHNTVSIVGAGLWVLSEYPFVKTGKIAFGKTRCTGTDCYANKGVTYTQVKVPGIGPVDIYSTHMNSRNASGSSDAKVWEAQRKQIAVIKYFLGKTANANVPAIFAGDFNVRTSFPTYPDLAAAVTMNNTGLFCQAYTAHCRIGEGTLPEELHNKVDQHFYRGTNLISIYPQYAAKTMRYRLGEQGLSDHLAYETYYSFAQK